MECVSNFENESESERMINEIITGNNVEILRQIPDDFLDLTVTSPPYDNLRDYKGYRFDFELLAKELYRVTKLGGVIVWVVGDATIKGSETGTSFRQALFFKEIGFNLHDTMIYQKKNPMPLKSNRYQPCFEYMFVFTKGRPITFNPIKEETKNNGVNSRLNQRKVNSEIVDGHGKGNPVKREKDRKNVWLYGVGYGVTTSDTAAFRHPAMFPEKLAEDHILSWSNPGDIVLDPFGGSGTTAKMAKLNDRQFIHIDISEEYNEIARQRIEGVDANGRS
jgi:DNA modification methylase